MNIKWDANKYTSDFSFVHQYGNNVIDLIATEKKRYCAERINCTAALCQNTIDCSNTFVKRSKFTNGA